MIFKILIIVLFIILSLKTVRDKINDYNIKQAGNEGEAIARSALQEVLNNDDYLINNVEVNINGKTAEFDNVVVNNCGVFIVEVKNYSGVISGNEDDDTWHKVKTTDAGNSYEKDVKNPIKQVKREINILKEFLTDNGIKVWVEGYVYMLNKNSPFASDMMFDEIDEIVELLHTDTKIKLSDNDVNKIVTILNKQK